MKFFLSSCFLAFVFLVPSLQAESEPEPVPDRSIYVKIILPENAPEGDKAPVVEPWIRKDLEEKGQKEFRAITDWISLSDPEGEPAEVWNAVLDGKSRGCAVAGLVEKRTRDGKVHVLLSGWTPVGPHIGIETLKADPGSREMIAVDLAGEDADPDDSNVIAYAVLSVGLPKGTEK